MGVYKIWFDGFESEGVYVGQSTNINQRWRQHLVELSRSKHHCKALQAAFIAHHSAVRFAVLEECECYQLEGRERWWMERLGPNLFNTSTPFDVAAAGGVVPATGGTSWKMVEEVAPPPCELCNNPRIIGERFCKTCRSVMKDAMKSKGYLQRLERPTRARSSEHAEVVFDTKFGSGR